MNLFGLSFVLFILKWSAGKGFSYYILSLQTCGYKFTRLKNTLCIHAQFFSIFTIFAYVFLWKQSL